MTLRLENISIVRGQVNLFPALTSDVYPGSILTVMGPSGIGKSSLLAYVAGVLPHGLRGYGDVILNGVTVTDLPTEHRGIGLLYQDALLFPHMSAQENVMFAIPRSERGKMRQQRAQDILDRVEMASHADQMPATLSGGQKTRIAMARLIAARPNAILLDEPSSALDVSLRGRMREFIFQLIQDQNWPALLVTHDPEDAAAAGGTIVTLQRQ